MAGTRTLRSSQPGLGPILGVRVLGEFGDDPPATFGARARKNYAGTSPITRQSGQKKTVHARYVHKDRLLDALSSQAQSALNASPGARAYYDQQRDRGSGHSAALRQLANRLVGILHGCLKTRTVYNEDTAWPTTITKITNRGVTHEALGCLCRPRSRITTGQATAYPDPTRPSRTRPAMDHTTPYIF